MGFRLRFVQIRGWGLWKVDWVFLAKGFWAWLGFRVQGVDAMVD